jgi:hypothetical protein
MADGTDMARTRTVLQRQGPFSNGNIEIIILAHNIIIYV